MDKSVERVEKPALNRGLFRERDRWTLGVFVKEPLPGEVKTRMVPPLCYPEAAELYRVALEETVRSMCGGPFRVVLFHAGDAAYFRRHFPGLPLRPQQGESLGERLEQAFASLFSEGCSVAGVIGSDSPDLPPALVAAAFAALRHAEAVTIPASDGGYVFIGMTRPLPQLFAGVLWSTGAVRQLTRQRADEAGIRYRECGEWDDIDDGDALRRLLQRSPASLTARHVAAHLRDALLLEP